MPSRWRIHLTGPFDADVPLEAPHAVVSRWLDNDTTHKAPVKPYAISPPERDGRSLVVEVRLLDDLLAEPLMRVARAGTPVRLGSHHYRVGGAPRLVEAVPWPELAVGGGPRSGGRENAWRVRFLSPTTFRSGDRSSPFPAPESVIRGLLSRWRALDPRSAPGTETSQLRSTWVSDLDGRTVAVRRAGRIVAGFVGQVRYVNDGSPVEQDAVRALLRLACFAGIGSHTAFGFGTVTLPGSVGPGPTGHGLIETDPGAARTSAVTGGTLTSHPVTGREGSGSPVVSLPE